MCRSSFNFRFIFYKIDFGRKNRNIGYIEKHEINRQYFVPTFLKERKLMVTSNQLGINLHTGSGSSGISFVPLFFGKKINGYCLRLQRRK